MSELLNFPGAAARPNVPQRTAPAPPAEGVHTPYADAVRAYATARPHRFTVPGHKGGLAAPLALLDQLGDATPELDIPLLIEGVDRSCRGRPSPLQTSLQRAAAAWGAARTWFLTGGATQGNVAACLAVALGERRVAVQRSSHGSTFNGIALAGLRPTTVQPHFDRALGIAHGVTPAQLAAVLTRNPGQKAVFIVSPTYFGVAADVAGLARVAHQHGAALIVDEAWGAHLRFSGAVPPDALSCGADLVVSSTHKHLGSLGGSAMLHLSHDAPAWLNERAIDRALGLISSTSPSSLLLASLDAARSRAEREGDPLLRMAVRELAEIRDTISSIPGLGVLGDELVGTPGAHALDPMRLCIDVRRTGRTGMELATALRVDHGIELELAQDRVLVAVFGLGESPLHTAGPLVDALVRMSITWQERPLADLDHALVPEPASATGWTPRDALWAPAALVPIEQAHGHVAAEAIVPYPPGIPAVLPGEVIDGAALQRLRTAVRRGVHLRGAADPLLDRVLVVDDPLAAQGQPRGFRYAEAA